MILWSIFGGDLILVGKKKDLVVCFSNTIFKSPSEVFADNSLPNERGCYLAAAAVSKSEKSTGLYSKMNEKRILQAVLQRMPFVFTRTQNPLVELGVTQQLFAFQKSGLIKNFSVRREIAKGVYGQMLTNREPTSRDEKINKVFRVLDKKNGDAFILIFSISY